MATSIDRRGKVGVTAIGGLLQAMTRWLLLLVVLTYIVTGFGITEFRIVERLSGGLLTKNIAFEIHDSLLIVLVVLLVTHIFLGGFLKSLKRRSQEGMGVLESKSRPERDKVNRG